MIEAAKPTAQPTSASPPSQGAGESRFDPVTGNWTLFAPHRSERPDEFVESRERIRHQVACPFCPGNETKTPPAVWIGHSENNEPVAKERQQPTELSQQQTAVKTNGRFVLCPTNFQQLSAWGKQTALLALIHSDYQEIMRPPHQSRHFFNDARSQVATKSSLNLATMSNQSLTSMSLRLHLFSKRIEIACDIGVMYLASPT